MKGQLRDSHRGNLGEIKSVRALENFDFPELSNWTNLKLQQFTNPSF